MRHCPQSVAPDGARRRIGIGSRSGMRINCCRCWNRHRAAPRCASRSLAYSPIATMRDSSRSGGSIAEIKIAFEKLEHSGVRNLPQETSRASALFADSNSSTPMLIMRGNAFGRNIFQFMAPGSRRLSWFRDEASAANVVKPLGTPSRAALRRHRPALHVV